MIFTIQLVASSLCILLIGSLARWVFLRFCSRRGIPDTIPWAGVSDGYFSWLSRARATMRSLSGSRALLDEGYKKVYIFSAPDEVPTDDPLVFQEKYSFRFA